MPTRRRLSYAIAPLVLSFLFLSAFALTIGYLTDVALAAPASTDPATTGQNTDSIQSREQTEATWTICAADCHFPLIQDAINSASVVAGDTLLVNDPVHTEGRILVDKDVTIRGQGAGNTIVQAGESLDESNPRVVFEISNGTSAIIEHMTVRHAFNDLIYVQVGIAVATSDDGPAEANVRQSAYLRFRGGGIVNSGLLALDDVHITENIIKLQHVNIGVATATAPITSTAWASVLSEQNVQVANAGVFNEGTLQITNSTISGNRAELAAWMYSVANANAGTITETAELRPSLQTMGAGIHNAVGGTLEMWNSTVSGNQATISATIRVLNEPPDELGSAPFPFFNSGVAGLTSPADVQVRTDKDSDNAYVYNEWTPESRRSFTSDDITPDLLQSPTMPSLAANTSTAVVSGTAHSVSGLYNGGTATIHFSTIAANEAPITSSVEAATNHYFEQKTGAIFNTGTLELDHTIVDALPETSVCAGSAPDSLGYNLDSDGSCALSETGDQSNVDPNLAPLGASPDSTPTHALLPDSPAVDAGDPTCPTVPMAQNDQRDLARPADGDGDGDAHCDIGAVELQIGLQLSGAVAGQVQVDGRPGNTFTVLPGQVTAGAAQTYTFNIYNAGSYAAENVRLEHYLPSGLQTISATPEQGSCETDLPANPGTPLVCQLGTLVAAETTTVTLTAQVAPSLPEGTTLNSHAVVSSDPTDPYTDNNTVVLNSTANSRADLIVAIEEHPQATSSGQPISYTFTVQNAGPSDAATADVSNVLPAGLTSAAWRCEATGGASCSGSGTGDVEDEVTLPAGSALTYTVEANALCTTEDNIASASSANDLYALNNSATVNVALYCAMLPLLNTKPPTIAPDLVVTSIEASNSDIELVIENVGNGPATEPFWVELYVNPQPAPGRVNQLWQHLGSEGIAWGVTDLPLAPGEQLTLRYDDAQFSGRYSNISWPLEPGTALYAQVDSFNASTDYGAVLESHEMNQGMYNNISGPLLVPNH